MIEIDQLNVTYAGSSTPAVADFSLSVGAGDRIGIVGESGSGKTTVAGAILRALPRSATITGQIRYRDLDLLRADAASVRAIRSVGVARIPQDPLASLNPVLRVGTQLKHVVRAHRAINRSDCEALVERSLAAVGIPEPALKVRAYPHELSGGMRQRVLIAMALINNPSLLIADEPTTALDVTVQAQIIDLLQEKLATGEMSLILITHDLGVAAELCPRMLVMQGGRVVESGATHDLARRPGHPYTKALFDSLRTGADANISGTEEVATP